MKSVAVIFLAVLIALQPLSRAWIVLDFSLRRAYIAKELCINKAKPQLHCNGKCYLTKKLKAADEQEKKSLPDVGKHKAETLFCQELASLSLPPCNGWDLPLLLPLYVYTPYSWPGTSVFHPPPFAA